jgi:hypothetical protein
MNPSSIAAAVQLVAIATQSESHALGALTGIRGKEYEQSSDDGTDWASFTASQGQHIAHPTRQAADRRINES